MRYIAKNGDECDIILIVMSNISKNLKILRKYKNLTQKQLGELIGYSNRAVGDWELGVSEPNLNTLKKLKDVFGVSYEDLLD